jgi:ribonucleoside-diphosphate reductase alpha chain
MLSTAKDLLEVIADQQVNYEDPVDSDIAPYVVKHVFTDTDKLVHATIPTQYQEYIYKSRYAKWREDDSRRENWPETPARYCDFFYNRFPDTFPYARIYNAIITMQDMPSMRALMTAGYALHRDNAAGYNCAYTAIDDPVAFDEIMYLLMCGTGVGFSVERQFINKLPRIADEFYKTNTTIVVEDSKIGWATSFREMISLLYSGKIPKWDTSKVRKAGEKLKTFGGRASGPAPLIALFHFTVKTFTKAKGRKLTSIECHDLVCKIADIVVVGGVRRSALISLSNLSDDRMREAKSGDWRVHEKQRELANNSVAYTEKPEMHRFMEEWLSLMKSYSGERGIFNREGLTKKIAKTGRRDTAHEFGTNPCSEIALRSCGFCNLTENVIRYGDTLEILKEKVEIATIMGTYQSTLVDFRYLRPIWKKNQEEERLLGVSMTGIMDHEILSKVSDQAKEWLTILREHAIAVNKVWADKLGIKQSAAITTVKPSGTVSQLVNSASGIHARYHNQYVRTVRADKKDPLCQYMLAQGFPNEDHDSKPDDMSVFSFPERSSGNSVYRNDMTAIECLEHYTMVKDYWCEHNVSITVNVKDHEWMEVGAWVYKHFDNIAGVSFLPYDGGNYVQAPYQECTEQEYLDLKAKVPQFNWDKLSDFEKDDATVNMKELACVGNSCEFSPV